MDFCFPLPCLLALPTEAWQGAEICIRLVEKVYVNLSGPPSHGHEALALAVYAPECTEHGLSSYCYILFLIQLSSLIR